MERMAVRAQTIVFDVLLAALAFAIAFFVAPTQPELGFGQAGALSFFQLAALYAAIAGAFSLIFRGELSPWRYVSIPDALVLARSALLTVGVFLLAVFVLDRAEGLPRSTLVMAPLFQMVSAMGVRIMRRALHEHALESFSPLKTITDRLTQSPSLLLIGPPSLADTYLRDVARSHDRTYTPVGIIGTDRRDVGSQVRGVCILDAIDQLDEAMADLRRWNRYPRAILFLEEPGKLKGLTADMLGRLKTDGIRLLRLPSIVELSQHDGLTLLPMRDINIEELLARDPIELDRRAIGGLIKGRRVLITGAGGSIGSELCRQVAAFNCALLTVVDFSETALFEIEREMRETFPHISVKAVLCDVRNAHRVNTVFAHEMPDLVFHAAALKHVSMVERHPMEGILTNVIGTWNVAEASKACGARQMVLISTDKAVDPTNAMGATKRLAEAVIQAQQTIGEGTRFSAVRFGNVLGSSGSVVPIFKSQIERGGPVTVTHPDMTRFFMTIPEAAQLVLHATAACHEDDRRDSRLFLLEMGEPVSILDLARQMIALSGRRDIEIEITGLRPGEKLTEALLDETERSLPAAPKVMEVISSSAVRVTSGHVEALAAVVGTGDVDDVRRALFDLVAQVRGEKPGAAPTLRVVAGG
ncbi:MAG: polysaccharide biosynthesis protein [Alphaproteobacteria bacterium]|nr:polysaccharide biosynthesis protein [Alphaproteobacteria bacterium]MBU1516851.1 polysaccharide biosynthesis protein [Alphaproteobacteria bacterium]MBU2092545.1 polysaccharide biosynthesis protein [Alphaproteobacteria bacterium]MBU2151343.1 polysaccharide biosynthesis protein [Alphaproteobacteria bacterium]MBU2309646.1 polysaccharide biosynthesis protein [Alphaproteobacteria bacterium]